MVAIHTYIPTHTHRFQNEDKLQATPLQSRCPYMHTYPHLHSLYIHISIYTCIHTYPHIHRFQYEDELKATPYNHYIHTCTDTHTYIVCIYIYIYPHIHRFQYEDELKANPYNYDAWFDYIRLEEQAGDPDKVCIYMYNSYIYIYIYIYIYMYIFVQVFVYVYICMYQ